LAGAGDDTVGAGGCFAVAAPAPVTLANADGVLVPEPLIVVFVDGVVVVPLGVGDLLLYDVVVLVIVEGDGPYDGFIPASDAGE
jgi:predicted membrane metal-binding protein